MKDSGSKTFSDSSASGSRAKPEGDGRLVAGCYDIVTRMTGEQFAFQCLQAVEHVVTDLDPGLGGELLQRGGVDVIGPVIDV